MHRRAEYIMLGLLLLGICSSTLFGQTEVRTIHLKDGSTIQGRIVAQDDSTLVVETDYGTLEIERRNIVRQEPTGRLLTKPTRLETETIHLQDGTTIKGEIVAENDSTMTVKTEYGTLEIRRINVLREEKGKQPPLKGGKQELQTVYLRDGTTITGVVVFEDDDSLKVKTSDGIKSIPQSIVSRLSGRKQQAVKPGLPAKPASPKRAKPQTAPSTATVRSQNHLLGEHPPFFSVAACGGLSFSMTKEAMKDYPETKFKNGAAFNASGLYHFAPSMSNAGFHLGVSMGHHSMELTEQGQSFGTLNLTPLTVLVGFGRYEFGGGESYFKGDLGLGVAFTNFDNGPFIANWERSYNARIKVETHNSFVFSLGGEVGLYLANSVSLFAGGQMLLQNVGSNWQLSAYNQTVPIGDFGDFYASSIQLLIGIRYWGFAEQGTSK
jgi:RNase P/RNase MRP subunit p29